MFQAGCRAFPQWSLGYAAAAVRSLSSAPVISTSTKLSRRSSVIPSHSESSTKWRYAADEVVRSMTALVQRGHCSNTCGMTLNTARPVSPKVFEMALMHLFRKVDPLKMCLRERNGRLWVAEMGAPKVDFQVLEDGNFEDTLRETGDNAYDLVEGPLWRARLVVCRPEEPCKMPQVKATFPHQYHFTLDLHHSINDGVSLMASMQIFFMILDGLLDGAQVDDSPIGGKLLDGRERRALEDRIKENLMKDPQRLKALLEERSKVKTRVPLITEAFGVPQKLCPVTCFQDPVILDDKHVLAFHAKCKAHKITFNSGFVGVMNAALVEQAREAGLVRNSYTISTLHPVDTRRYMGNVKSMVWGYHSIPMTQTMATPWDVRKNFWKYGTQFDVKLRDHIKNLGPLEERVLDTMLQPQSPANEHKYIYDYMFSNVYSPRAKTYGNGKHVQVTNCLNYIPLTDNSYGALGGVAKFRDDVRFQLFYSSSYVAMEKAVGFTKKVVSVFNEVAKSAD